MDSEEVKQQHKEDWKREYTELETSTMLIEDRSYDLMKETLMADSEDKRLELEARGVNKDQYYHYRRNYVLYRTELGVTCIVKKADVNRSESEQGFTPPRVVKRSEVFDLIYSEHHGLLHPRDSRKMKQKLDKFYCIPESAIKAYVKTCPVCIMKERNKTMRKQGVKPILSNYSKERGQIDLINYIHAPCGPYKWLLRYSDHFSGYSYSEALTSKSSTEVAASLLNHFLYFGFPTILHSDNGREFDGKVVKLINAVCPEVKIVKGRPYHPQSQGQVERTNGIFKDKLLAWCAEHAGTGLGWAHGHKFVTYAMNNQPSAARGGQTPYQIVFGEVEKVGLKRLTTLLHQDVVDLIHDEEQILKLANARTGNDILDCANLEELKKLVSEVDVDCESEVPYSDELNDRADIDMNVKVVLENMAGQAVVGQIRNELENDELFRSVAQEHQMQKATDIEFGNELDLEVEDDVEYQLEDSMKSKTNEGKGIYKDNELDEDGEKQMLTERETNHGEMHGDENMENNEVYEQGEWGVGGNGDDRIGKDRNEEVTGGSKECGRQQRNAFEAELWKVNGVESTNRNMKPAGKRRLGEFEQKDSWTVEAQESREKRRKVSLHITNTAKLKQAEKMIKQASPVKEILDPGDVVLIELPRTIISAIDFKHLRCCVLEVTRRNQYRLCTVNGVLEKKYNRSDLKYKEQVRWPSINKRFQEMEQKWNAANEKDKLAMQMTELDACRSESACQREVTKAMPHCRCTGRCNTKSCSCMKAGVYCSTRCHAESHQRGTCRNHALDA